MRAPARLPLEVRQRGVSACCFQGDAGGAVHDQQQPFAGPQVQQVAPQPSSAWHAQASESQFELKWELSAKMAKPFAAQPCNAALDMSTRGATIKRSSKAM